MRIQHNIMAMNAYRNYTSNVNAMKSNLEKLSSGYKINRAGDDAAGLAISEKMRAQITGLSAAQKNVKDGISLVQTAEGAMQEVQDMLNRMVYLATQSANGTYDNEVDRANLQKELEQLSDEIDRIADSSNFNGIKLLDGSMDGKKAEAAVADAKASAMTNVDVTHKKDAVLSTEDQAMIFTVDLSNLKVTSDADDTVPSLTIGGVTVSAAATDKYAEDAVITGSEMATKIAAAHNTEANAVTINGSKFTISDEGEGVLKFTMVESTIKDWTDNDTWNATAAVDVALGTGITSANNAEPLKVNLEQEVVIGAPGRKYAQGEFTLKATDIKDGTVLEIGGETYTFAVGKDSKVDTKGKNVVNLKDFEEGATDIEKAAAGRLSKVAEGNKNFKVTGDFNTGKIGLTERKDSEIDYNKNNLAGATNATENDGADSDWTGLVKIGQAEDIEKAVSKVDSDSEALTLQIGDTAESFNQLKVSIGDIHVSALGIDNISIAKQSDAQAAVQKIKDAINTVSGIRGDLGATQNRLEHTANNLSVMQENITDAESSIRDTDVAEEMMAYTKNNILIQSAQAMLAQANQVPQGVLQLLQ